MIKLQIDKESFKAQGSGLGDRYLRKATEGNQSRDYLKRMKL